MLKTVSCVERLNRMVFKTLSLVKKASVCFRFLNRLTSRRFYVDDSEETSKNFLNIRRFDVES